MRLVVSVFCRSTPMTHDPTYCLYLRCLSPGMWLFHCHIEYHVDIGMGFIIQVGDKSEFPKPPKNFPRCGSWNDAEDPDDEEDGGDDAGKQPVLVQCVNPPNSAESPTAVVTGVLVAAMLGLNILTSPTSSFL